MLKEKNVDKMGIGNIARTYKVQGQCVIRLWSRVLLTIKETLVKHGVILRNLNKKS